MVEVLDVDFCIHAGIICIICGYPIYEYELNSFVKYIGKHEKLKRHGGMSPVFDREQLVIAFKADMKQKAMIIRKLLAAGKEEEANEKGLKWIGQKQMYKKCYHPDCNTLVVSENHKNRSHRHLVSDKVEEFGVISTCWKKHNPTVIPCMEFNFKEQKYFNPTFWYYLTSDDVIDDDNKCVCGNVISNNASCSICNINRRNNSESETAIEFGLILQQQSKIYDDEIKNSIVHSINQQHSPNLWIEHTEWDRLLLNCSYQNIYKVVTAPPTDTQQTMIDNIDKTLWNAINALEKIGRSHHIMHEVQRRNNGVSRKPFKVVMNKATWEKYFRIIKKICLVFFKIIDRSNHEYDNVLPTIAVSDEQYTCYTNCYDYEFGSSSDSNIGNGSNSSNNIGNSSIDIGNDSSSNNDSGSGIIDNNNNNSSNNINSNSSTSSNNSNRLYTNLLISFINQTTDIESYKGMLLSIIALLSVKQDNKLADARDTTPIYAAILATYKLLMLSICIDKSYILESEHCVFRIRELTTKYLRSDDPNKLPSPLTTIINSFAYANATVRQMTSEGNISWKKATLHYRTVSISMDEFKSTIVSQVESTKQLLYELLHVTNGNCLPIIPWDDIMDDHINNDCNYSFLFDASNSHWTLLDQYKKELICRSSNYFFNGNNKIDNSRIQQYERIVSKFLKSILALVHVTGGQPARGTEVTNTTYMNTEYSVRNVIIYNGLVCIRSSYHKGMIQFDKIKKIYRFLPKQVGELLIYYLWLVLPFWQDVKGVDIQAVIRSPYIWSKSIGLQNQTQVIELYTTDILSLCLAALFLNGKINVSTYRHMVIAIARRYLRSALLFGDSDGDTLDEEDEALNQVMDDLWDLQATHTSHTANAIYAREVSDDPTSHRANIDGYFKISIEWHQFLFDNFNSYMNKKRSIPTSLQINNALVINDRLQDQLYNIQVQRLTEVSSLPLDWCLKTFLNDPNATFRGNQYRALQSIINRHPYILQIAGTGIGKSISFMLPAKYSIGTGITIVIVPLLSLQYDLLLRCLQHQIRAGIWTNDSNYRQNNYQNIVLVTPETATTIPFLDYINQIKSTYKLDRIIIDECHMYFSSTKDFRPKMVQIKALLHHAAVQVVLLTATMPINCTDTLFGLLGIQKQDCTIIRDVTVRKNIHYNVDTIDGYSYLESVRIYINRYPNERIIIYVQSIKIGENISKKYKYPFYYSGQQNKEQIYNNWKESTTNKIIVATNSLGCGIDISDIRLILHVGCPESMINFIQESGRAGRDKFTSHSILLHFNSGYYHQLIQDDMIQYVNSNVCRRTHIDRIMDGNIYRIKCDSTDENLCDICTVNNNYTAILDDSDLIDYNTTENIPFIDDIIIDTTNTYSNRTNCITPIHLDPTSITPIVNNTIDTVETVESIFVTNDTNDTNDTNINDLLSDDLDDDVGTTTANDTNDTNINDLLSDDLDDDVGTTTGMNENSFISSSSIKKSISSSINSFTTLQNITNCDSTCNVLHRPTPTPMKRNINDVRMVLFGESNKKQNLDSINSNAFVEIEQFGKWIECLSDNRPCLYCIVNGTNDVTKSYPDRTCKKHQPTMKEVEMERKEIGIQVGENIKDMIVCQNPGCYIPQMWCNNWKSDGNGGHNRIGKKCQHRDVLLDIILLLERCDLDVAEYIKKNVGNDKTILLTETIDWGDSEYLLLHRVFYDVYKMYFIDRNK